MKLPSEFGNEQSIIRKHFALSHYMTPALALVGMPLLYVISRYNYNLFHSFADGVSIIIAAFAFTIIWNSRSLVDNNYFLVVGIGFFFFAFLNFLHLLGNKGMGIFPEYGNMGPTFYIAGRYVLSATLMIAPIFIHRKLNTALVFLSYALVTVLFLFSVFYLKVFPACIIEGVGLTPFKIISDYIIIFILIGALILLITNRRFFDPGVLRAIVFSIIFLIASGLTFTLYTDPFGVTNLIGHLFQIASFYLVYVVLVETSVTKPQEILFRKLKEHEVMLTENLQRLDLANTGLQQEIAERKRIEDVLRQNERLLRDIIDSSPSAIYLKDLEGRFITVNTRLEKMLGMARENIRSKSCSDIHAKGVLDYWQTHDLQVIKSGLPMQVEEAADLEDGLHVFLSNKFPLIDASGKLYGVGSISHDITERKRVEEALRKAHEELEIRVQERTAELRQSEELAQDQRREIEAYYHTAPIGLCVLDTNLRFLRVNERLAEMNGLTTSDHIGRTVRETIPRIADEAERIVRRIIETGEPVTGMEITSEISIDGGPRRVWVVDWHPVKNSLGKVVNISVVVEEVTERRNLEDHLRQSQKMEAIGTLAGGIAHDFNNILAAIIGFTEIALEDAEDRPDIQRSLEKVLKSGTRARELVKQILTFSRKTKRERGPLSLSPIIKETIQLLRASIPTMIEIRVSITAGSDMVLASPVEIQQILMNLAVNAAHAMQQEGGIIEVSLADIRFESDTIISGEHLTPGDYVRLEVKDTGTGMSFDIVKRIFEPFFTTREVGKGTGMGLAVVYGIVKDLQGAITVESEVGKGSIFKVFLPRMEGDIIKEALRAPATPGGTERILFIDDEDMLAEWGRATLQRLGYRVTAVTDSVEALKIFSTDPSFFDLIITDHAMPHMAGFQLVSEFLTMRRDIPIILCTGFSETISPEKARQMGIREFLYKPLVKQELAEAVRRVLDGKGWRAE